MLKSDPLYIQGHQLLDDFVSRSGPQVARSPPPEAKLDAAFFADLNSSYHVRDPIR